MAEPSVGCYFGTRTWRGFLSASTLTFAREDDVKTEKRRRVLRAVAFLYGVVGALLMVAPTYGLLQLLHVKAMSGKYDRVPREWLVDAVDLNVRFVHIVLGIGFLMLVFAYSVWSFLKPAKDQAEIANQPSQPIAGKPGSG